MHRSRQRSRSGGGGGATVPTGGILSVTIADSTAIDPQSSIGASGSGWVAIVVLKGLTSLVGTAVPSALTLQVSDPGYTTAGATTTVNRTVTGVLHMRRQWPNGNSKMISTDGTNLTLYITLDSYIYSGTTIVSANIGGTFYPSCVASAAPTRTNLSTYTYAQIKPKFAWLNFQNASAGSTVYVEAVAGHRYARAGQQVACIEYYVTDGTNQSATVRVSTPTTSTLQTQGNIAEVWSATLDMSTQTQGGISRVNARVLPFIGDSTGILDLSTDGYAWPTSLPITQLRVFCDRTGAYGGGYAYVNGVGGGSPQVSATPATARANPYATLRDAAVALQAWNNANRSHNDYGGGFIRLMDNSGTPRTHTVSSGLDNAPGLCHLRIEKDPLATAAVTITPGAQWQGCPNTVYSGLTCLTNSAVSDYMFLGQNGSRDTLFVENCTFDNTSNAPNWVFWYQLTSWRNNIFTNGNNYGLSDTNTALMLGCTRTGAANVNSGYQPKAFIGNNLPSFACQLDDNASGDQDHGRFIYNNIVNNIYLNRQTTPQTLDFGVAVIQNLCETLSVAASCHLFGDGDVTTILDVVDHHNTGVGERSSRFYNDVVATRTIPNGLIKRCVSRYNIWDNTNQKADNFAGGGIGSVGGWAYLCGVENNGNVSLFGDVNRIASSAPSNDAADNYLGNAWLSTSEYNLFRTAKGFTQAQIMALFSSYTVAPQGVPARGGNYRPLSTASDLKSRVPVGFSVLTRDISGTTRRTDGTGAAGAYESA